MTEKAKQFAGPAVGYGRVDDKHMVFLRAENAFLNTQTARELATDLLIWAERIDERNRAETEDEESHD